MVDFGQYPLVYQLQNGMPIGLAETSSLSAVNLVVSTVSATNYLNLSSIIEFTGVIGIGDATSIGALLVDNTNPNFPLIRPLTANVNDFVGFSLAGDNSVTIGWGANPLPLAQGGTGATDVATAQIALNLVPGSDVQQWNANLQELSELTIANKQILVGGPAASLTVITAPTTDNTFLKYNTAGGGTFSWGAGGSVSLPGTQYAVLYENPVGTIAQDSNIKIQNGIFSASNVSATNASAQSFIEGGQTLATKYQGYDSTLNTIAALNPGNDELIYFNGINAATTTPFTLFGRSLVDDSDAAAAKVTLQLDSYYQPCNVFLGTLASKGFVVLDSADVCNTLPISKGGTNKTSFSNDQLIYGQFSQNANLTFANNVLKSPSVSSSNASADAIFENGTNISSKYLTQANAATTYTTQSTYNTFTGTLALSAGLKDVIITSPSNGQVLKWTGSNWANATDATGAGFTINDVRETGVDGFVTMQTTTPTPIFNLKGTKPGENFTYKILGINSAGNAVLIDYGATQRLTDTSKFTLSSANYYSALQVDQLSSVDHFNENSYIFYAEVNTLSAINLSATNYYNLPSSTITWLNATNSVNAQTIRKYVKNSTGATIPKGRPVTVIGATGDNALIAPLSSINTHVPEAIGLSNHVFGLTETEILTNDFGYIITEGILSGTGGGVNALDTSLFAAGDILYVSSNGLLTNTRPTPPYESHPIGYVIRSQSNNGSIYVKIETQPEINDIVGFNLASSLLNGDLITYDLTTSTFVNTQSINLSGSIRGGSLSATNLSATNARVTSLSATNLSATNARITSLSATTVSAATYLNYPITQAVGSQLGAIQFTDGAGTFDANNSFYYDSPQLYLNYGIGGELLTDVATISTQLSIDTATISSPANQTLLITSSLRVPTVSATTYLNLPSGVATWNANKIQGTTVASTTPNVDDTLVYNGAGWVPKNILGSAYVLGNNLIL